jgi:hypothetical protein
MKIGRIGRGVVALFVAAGATALTAGLGNARSQLRSPICKNGLSSVERDPRLLLPLEADSVAAAATAALRLEKPSNKPWLSSAAIATADTERGPEAKTDCGSRVWHRTVVVYITLRAFGNSASLSERVDFVGRFRDGYHVWQVVH